jgi:myo-inositol-1(or 4)-monophosphatase
MDFIQAAVNANREIYELLGRGLDNTLFCYVSQDEGEIGEGGDRSLSIDLKAEAIFVNYLSNFGKIYSEESGLIGEGENEIIIDPIDGSSNIASCFPYYGSSVSLRVKGKTVKSIVTNLASGEFFVNDGGVRYKSTLLSMEKEPYGMCENPKIGIVEKAYSNPGLVAMLARTGMKFRSPGAVALSLAYARDVNFVIFSGRHRIFDMDAGLHLTDDLYQLVKDDLILVSRDAMIFNTIKNLIFSNGCEV